MSEFITADSHAPHGQYDVFFKADKPVPLTKDNTIIYLDFKDFGVCMDWLHKQDHTASLLMRNGDMGLEENEFAYYFASTAGLTSFMFFDDIIPENLNYMYVNNLNVEHPKMRHHPLGVLTRNIHTLVDVRDNYIPTKQDKYKNMCYVNFNHDTCVFRQFIPRVYASGKPWVTIEENSVSQEDYYKQFKKHHYVACPRGNGHDSFRVWEALKMGAVPIVTRTVGMERLSAFLPILVLDKWSEMTEERLTDELPLLRARQNQWPEMTGQDFWTKHVKKQRSLHLETEEVTR
jgi:hypothetical protein